MQRVIDFEYKAFTLFGMAFQPFLLSITFVTLNAFSYNPNLQMQLVWAVPVSLATTTGITICFLFLRGLRCFNSPGSLLSIMRLRPYHITGNGLPHSEILGLQSIFRPLSDPKLIAGYHVLLRLLVPSYPPYTLSNLYFGKIFFFAFSFQRKREYRYTSQN